MGHDVRIRSRLRHLAAGVIVLLILSAFPRISPAGETTEPDNIAADGEARISALTVHVVGAYGREEELEALARDLIGIEKGTVLDDARFEAGLKALRESGLFKEIEVPDPIREEQGWHFFFQLTAFKRIKDLRIYNAFPMMERRVKSALRLYVGDPFKPYRFEEKIKRLEAV